MKQAITRAIRRARPQEVKFATMWDGQQSVAHRYGVQFNAPIGTGTNYALIPSIPSGSDNGQRNGAKISPKRLVVDFWVNATNYKSSVDLVARLFILESLNIRDTAAINTVDMTTLLDHGQTQGSFDGYASDLHGLVNKEQFKVYMDKKFKIQKGYGQGPTTINLFDGGITQPNVFHHVRVVLKCPKTLHYRDPAQVLPDGWAPFFNCGYAVPSMVDADGADIINTRLQVSWTSTLFYTDA